VPNYLRRRLDESKLPSTVNGKADETFQKEDLKVFRVELALPKVNW
jgi:hypothetical protein